EPEPAEESVGTTVFERAPGDGQFEHLNIDGFFASEQPGQVLHGVAGFAQEVADLFTLFETETFQHSCRIDGNSAVPWDRRLKNDRLSYIRTSASGPPGPGGRNWLAP